MAKLQYPYTLKAPEAEKPLYPWAEQFKNKDTNSGTDFKLPPLQPLEPFGGYSGYSPNWQKITSATAQKEALTGQETQPQETYGLLKGHWDIASKAVMEARNLYKTRQQAYQNYLLQRSGLELQGKGLELQEKQLEESDKGGTVICTELHKQGHITDEQWCASFLYGFYFIDEETYQGYLQWASKVVKWMQKSRLITRVIKPFGIGYIEEATHRMRHDRRGSWIGKVLLKYGVPFCRYLYIRKHNMEANYGSL